MGRLRNYRHELAAHALAEGKSRAEALAAGGYPACRGNHNRLAQRADVVARVEEIRKGYDEIVDLRKMDRVRLLVELARVACADPARRAAITEGGPDAVMPEDSVLVVQIKLDGVPAKHIEMRLLDDRGALTHLLRYHDQPSAPASVNFERQDPTHHAEIERVLQVLLRTRQTDNHL